ncbi:MAG: peptide MFS transporter [Acidobacteriota bacterium]|jgi:proton-dependent oligopeptide transporter, POT family
MPLRKHPKGLTVLFFTEMWERFGFYTMLAIFTLYLDEYFHFAHRGAIYGGFLALVYFTPIGGGWVADRLLGFRKTIMLGAILMAVGYGMLAFHVPVPHQEEVRVQAAEQQYSQAKADWLARSNQAAEEGESFTEPMPRYSGPPRTTGRTLFFMALVVLVMGNGLFKPNISVMVGNLYPEGSPLKDSAFNIFYMGINVGAFFAPFAAAALRNTLGWGWAFGAASLGMVISLGIFRGFQRFIIHAEISHSDDSVVKGEAMTPKQEWSRILALLTVYVIVILFWMSFHQNGFTLTLWARDSTAPLFGMWKIPAEVFAAANPFFVIALTPLVVWFWNQMQKRGLEPSTPGKMAVGMLLTAAAFGIMAIAGRVGGDYGRVSPAWLIAAYAVVTTGELCLSPMGLSFCSKVAPPRFRGIMMGGWFGATAVGNYLAGGIDPLWENWPHSAFFGFLTATSIGAAILLALVLKKVNAAVAS